MESSSNQLETISTVQLSPFGEDQWHRIVTYSPIYVHWTDMVLANQQQRPTTSQSRTRTRKLNSKELIDMETLKLEDEAFLNQLNRIKEAANITRMKREQKKSVQSISKPSSENDFEPKDGSLNDFNGSSSGLFSMINETSRKPRVSHYDSFVNVPNNSSRWSKSSNRNSSRPVTTSGSMIKRWTGSSQVTPLTSAYLRRAGLGNDMNSISGISDQRSSSPLSVHSTSKRTTISAHSSQRPQLKRATLSQNAPSTHTVTSSVSLHEKLTGESLTDFQKRRAKSSVTTRSLISSIKAKNERARQQQNMNLKTILGDSWKTAPWSDSTMEESIPNSIDVMHQMCGPATAFERNLRQNYHRHLKQIRHGAAPH